MFGFQRFLLFLVSLTTIAYSVLCISYLLGQESVYGLYNQLLHSVRKRDMFFWGFFLFNAIVLLGSLRLLYQSFSRSKHSDRGIERVTDIGYIGVSLKTIESLAINAARKAAGIRDLTARVRLHPEQASVGIGLRIIVDGEVPVQELSHQLQKSVKHEVETIAGVKVDQVSVYVAETNRVSQRKVRIQ